MRLITGDECGLLKEVVPEIGRQKDDDADDPNTPVKPYHMDLAIKVTKVGSRRIAPTEEQTRDRGVVDLTWLNMSERGDGLDGNEGQCEFGFAALRRNGSVQLWSASSDDPQKHGRYKVDFATTNVFSAAWEGKNGDRACRPLGMGYIPQSQRLCVGDTAGNIAVLDNGKKEGEAEVVHTYHAYENTKRGKKITYTPGSFENTQLATTMAVHPIQGRVAIGGRERETTLVDLETGQLVWKAKNLPPDPQTLLQQPVWPTAICFLGEDSNIMAVGTAYKEVRLYDVRESSKVRRPTAVTPEGLFEYRVTSLCSLENSSKNNSKTTDMVVGDAAGFLYQLDLRKLGKDRKVQAHKDLCRFVGPGGSVRQIKLHPTSPRMAVVGLDRMLRIYDTNTRKQVDCVYLKQRLNTVLFHSDDDWDLALERQYDDSYDDDYANVVDEDDVVQDYVDSDQDDGEEMEQSGNFSDDDDHDDSDDDDDGDEEKPNSTAVPSREKDSRGSEESEDSDDGSDDSKNGSESESESESGERGPDSDDDDDNNNYNDSEVKHANNKTSNGVEHESTKKKQKEVQVFRCPSAFPISAKNVGKKRQRSNEESSQVTSKKPDSVTAIEDFLDLHEAAKEVRAYGATAFIGQQKRDYADEKYFELTGRHKKKHHVPLPIARGIKKARGAREERERKEARESGVVLAKKSSDKTSKNRKDYDKTYDKFGPAPSIGFTKNGVFRYSGKGGQSKKLRR